MSLESQIVITSPPPSGKWRQVFAWELFRQGVLYLRDREPKPEEYIYAGSFIFPGCLSYELLAGRIGGQGHQRRRFLHGPGYGWLGVAWREDGPLLHDGETDGEYPAPGAYAIVQIRSRNQENDTENRNVEITHAEVIRGVCAWLSQQHLEWAWRAGDSSWQQGSTQVVGQIMWPPEKRTWYEAARGKRQ